MKKKRSLPRRIRSSRHTSSPPKKWRKRVVERMIRDHPGVYKYAVRASA